MKKMNKIMNKKRRRVERRYATCVCARVFSPQALGGNYLDHVSPSMLWWLYRTLGDCRFDEKKEWPSSKAAPENLTKNLTTAVPLGISVRVRAVEKPDNESSAVGYMEALLLTSAVGDGDLLKVYSTLVGGGDVNAAYVGVSPMR